MQFTDIFNNFTPYFPYFLLFFSIAFAYLTSRRYSEAFIKFALLLFAEWVFMSSSFSGIYGIANFVYLSAAALIVGLILKYTGM